MISFRRADLLDSFVQEIPSGWYFLTFAITATSRDSCEAWFHGKPTIWSDGKSFKVNEVLSSKFREYIQSKQGFTPRNADPDYLSAVFPADTQEFYKYVKTMIINFIVDDLGRECGGTEVTQTTTFEGEVRFKIL